MNKILVLGILISLSSIVYGNDLDEALLEASRNGNIIEVKSLIKKGANVNSKNTSVVSTTLMEASWYGHLKVVKYLVENGANLNTKDKFGWTALMGASENEYSEIVEYLKSKGATE